MKCLNKLISINPKNHDAHANLAACYSYLKDFRLCLRHYKLSKLLNKSTPLIDGAINYAEAAICDWSQKDNTVNQLYESLIEGIISTAPFNLLCITDNRNKIRHITEIYSSYYHPTTSEHKFNHTIQNKKIKIGYFSPDLREHPVGHLMEGIIKEHDRDHFEIYAFYFGPNIRDKMREQFEHSFDHFFDVNRKSDSEIAEFARSHEIDICIDLCGHTADTRLSIYSYRAAPIQAHYLGYSGTLGVNYIDYLIADQVVIPQDHQDGYCEKIAYLPFFQGNNFKTLNSELTKSRQDYGLPEDAIVLCSFNQNVKYNPEIFDIWMKILIENPHTVLWLQAHNPVSAKDNILKYAKKFNIDGTRIIFAERTETIDEHINRYKLADLFVDTFPYNAHTTASDALYAGLPLVTLAGNNFTSRVAASILTNLNLSELICYTKDEYFEKINALCKSPSALAELKVKLAHEKSHSIVFDTVYFTRKLEECYLKMVDNYNNGILDNIVIER